MRVKARAPKKKTPNVPYRGPCAEHHDDRTIKQTMKKPAQPNPSPQAEDSLPVSASASASASGSPYSCCLLLTAVR